LVAALRFRPTDRTDRVFGHGASCLLRPREGSLGGRYDMGMVENRLKSTYPVGLMADSRRDPIIRPLPQPADMNGNGDIFGGWVLSQMDVAAAPWGQGRQGPRSPPWPSGHDLRRADQGRRHGLDYGELKKIGRTSITIDLETVGAAPPGNTTSASPTAPCDLWRSTRRQPRALLQEAAA